MYSNVQRVSSGSPVKKCVKLVASRQCQHQQVCCLFSVHSVAFRSSLFRSDDEIFEVKSIFYLTILRAIAPSWNIGISMMEESTPTNFDQMGLDERILKVGTRNCLSSSFL